MLLRGLVSIGLGMAAVVGSAMSTAVAQDAIREGDLLTGELRLVRTKHPNGTPIGAFQIVSLPRAMPANDEFCDGPATTFHIAAMDDATRKQLRALIGKKVSLKAEELVCSHTAWHIGDAVVLKWSALTKR
jgi:hypothetical protein